MIAPTCHPDRAHYARGLCKTCCKQVTRNGTLDQHPRRRVTYPFADLVERYLPLRAQGLATKQIARRLGVTTKTVYRALSRARAAGDTRVPAARRYQRRAVAA